jgi:hypothetical protein
MPTEKERGERSVHKSSEEEVNVPATAQDQSRGDLLDDEGDLSPMFIKVLYQIFQRFSHCAQEHDAKSELDKSGGCGGEGGDSAKGGAKEDPARNKLIMTEEELDSFTRVVNGGQVMSEESKDEMKEYLDVDEQGNLTVSSNARSAACSSLGQRGEGGLAHV